MGWTVTPYHGSRKEIRSFLDAEFSEDNTKRRFEVLKSSLVSFCEYYAAYRVTNKETGIADTIGLVALVKYSATSERLSWKEMSEGMYPYYFRCPRSILKLLSPTDDQNSSRWRLACWERLNGGSRNVQPGDIVVFDNLLECTDNTRAQRFQAYRHGKRALRFISLPAGRYGYRIPNINQRTDFKIETPSTKES